MKITPIALLALCALSFHGAAAGVDLEKSFHEQGISSPRLDEHLQSNNKFNTPVGQLLAEKEGQFKNLLYVYVGAIFSENIEFNLEQKQVITDVLVTGIHSQGNIDRVLRRLSEPPIEAEDFSPAAQEVLKNYDYRKFGYSPDYIRVLGVAGVDNPNLDLKELSERQLFSNTDPDVEHLIRTWGSPALTYFTSSSWAALIVRARRGEPDAIARVVGIARYYLKESVSIFTSIPQIVRDIGYVRQPETVDFLVDLLDTQWPPPELYEQYKEVIEGVGGLGPTPAHRAVAGLALSLEGFPMEYWRVRDGGEIQSAKDWLKANPKPWHIRGHPAPPKTQVSAPAPPPPAPAKLAPVVPAASTPSPSFIAHIAASPWTGWIILALILSVALLWLRHRQAKRR